MGRISAKKVSNGVNHEPCLDVLGAFELFLSENVNSSSQL
jgi:hypothetical protein